MHDMAGHPNIPKATMERIIAFLERPDFHIVNRIVKIDMENPYVDRKTIYCGNYMK